MSRGQAYARLMARLESVRGQGVTLGLDRVQAALARLGDPHASVPAIQIAGTNGKGSCAAMTESILRASGFRTGLFTSPHLLRFTERIRIDGEEVDGDRLAGLDAKIQATGIPLSYFEIATLLAFRAFAEFDVDIAVLETGLGGRLDATTACRPLACAITTIGLDHESLLGGSLAAIAHEKAWIAKPGIPLFLGPLPEEAQASVDAVARAQNTPLRRYGVDFPPAPCAPALAGQHQERNAAIAVALATEAACRLGRPLGSASILQGLAGVRWPGRLESAEGNLLFDCAHNPDGAKALADALPGNPYRVLVTSIVRDKDAATMLAIWAPLFDEVVVTTLPSERSRSPENLAALVGETRGGGRKVVCVPDPRAALTQARQRAGRGGLVVVAGSLFLVGLLRGASAGHSIEPSDPLP